MKVWKRILSIALVVLMCLTAAPLDGFVDIELPELDIGGWLEDVGEVFVPKVKATETEYISGYYTYTVSNGEATITDVDNSISGDVVIPDELGGYPVTVIGHSSFAYCSRITSITIPDSVIMIGNCAFEYCGLTSMTMGNGVTEIGERAFSTCRLTSITLGNGVTTIGEDAFYFCRSLTSITIPDSVTTIGEYAFKSCESLTNITIPDNVTTIEPGTFSYCENLTSITIPDSVTVIDYSAFRDCESLMTITIPDSVTTIGYGAFYGSGLTSITIPDSVTKIYDEAFRNCNSLTSVTIGNGVTEIYSNTFKDCNSLASVTIGNGITEIFSNTFEGCNSLKNVVIGNGVTTIGEAAFKDCKRLTSITIPDNVTTIGFRAFYGSGLTSITIPSSVTEISYNTFGECKSLKNVTINNGVTTIGKSAFYGCSSLTSIVIPDSVTAISSSAFDNCVNLAKIMVNVNNLYYSSDEYGILFNKDQTRLIKYPNANTRTEYTIPDSVTVIDYSAFSGCKSLKKVTIGNGVTTIGSYVFENCTSLANITIPDGVTSIGDSAFYCCSSLTSITIPDGVTTIGSYVFENCTSLTSITIPDSVTTIGKYAFHNCTSLTSITIPDSVTTIGKDAFYNCTSLTNITIPNGITEIGDFVFRGCSSLTSITIPDSVTIIGDYAFENCTSLENITIPDEVTSIGGYAFYGCSGLTSITIPDRVTTIGNRAFYYCVRLENITIGNSVTSIGDSVFYCCSSLTSITIPDSVTTLGVGVFYDCDSLTSITIGDGITTLDMEIFELSGIRNISIGSGVTTIIGFLPRRIENIIVDEDNLNYSTDEYGALYNKNKTELIHYTTSDNGTYTIPNSVITIGEQAFYNCSSLKSVTIPNSVTTIGDSAFYGCSSLKSVTIPNGVTTIGDSVFYGCSSLTSIIIPDSVTTIGNNAFNKCSSITSLIIPDSVKTIGENAFEFCGFETITIGKGIETIAFRVFSNCDSLTSITIPSNVTKIDTDAFYACSKLKNVVIEDGVTSIGDYAFMSCTVLERITISDSVTQIGKSAFNLCNSLKNVYYTGTKEQFGKISIGSYNTPFNNAIVNYYVFIGDNLKWGIEDGDSLYIRGTGTVISDFEPGEAPWYEYKDEIEEIYIFDSYIERIGQYAFYGLENVEHIHISCADLSYIGQYAFYGLESMKQNVIFIGTESQWKKIEIDYGNDVLKRYGAHCTVTDTYIVGENIKYESQPPMTEQDFVSEHIDFVKNSGNTDFIKNNSFSKLAKIDKKVLRAYKSWDVIGDIGKAISFSIDGYACSANYYETYLADMILAFYGEESVNINDTAKKHYTALCDSLMILLKTSAEWDEKAEEPIKELFKKRSENKSYTLDANAQKILEKVCGDLYKNNKSGFASVFKGINGIADLIFTGQDIYAGILKVCDAYAISKAFEEINDEFFTICYEAAMRLAYTGGMEAQYGEWFWDAVKQAQNSDMRDLNCIFDATYTAIKTTNSILYDKIIKNVVQSLVYPVAGKLLGLTGGGAFLAASVTYNCTFSLINEVTKLDKESSVYQVLNYITPIEKQLRILMSTYQSRLVNNPTEENARKYDMAFKILKQTNIYLFETDYKYCSYKKDSQEMKLATAYKNKWNKMNCHYGNYGSEYNMFSTYCPVDVYIYDFDGLLITSIVNEEVVEYNFDITVMNSNGHKTFVYPADKDYSIKIVAREDGEMDYSVNKITSDGIVSELSSYNVPLSQEQEFSVAEDCKLSTNDTLIDFDYNSSAVCDEHTFGKWIEGTDSKTRICVACGFKEFELDCGHNHSTIEVYSVLPSCTVAGHTVYICGGCGEQVTDGKDVDATGHSYEFDSVVESTCTQQGYTKYTCLCGDSYVGDYVDAAGHTEEKILGYVASCTASGLTDGVKCSVCDEVLVAQKVISATGHTEEKILGYVASCTASGLADGVKCSVCNETLVPQKVINATGHTEVKINGYSATCTENGLSAGVKCGTCSEILVSQQTVFAQGHYWSDWYVVDDSVKERSCHNCSAIETTQLDCDCNCHSSSSFLQFFYKFARFFWQLFNMENKRICNCGKAHW